MGQPRIFKQEDMLSVAEVATRLRCSRQHIYNLIELGESEGGLPAFRFGGKRGWRVPKPNLEKFISATKIDPTV